MTGATIPDAPIPLPPVNQRPLVWAYAGFWWRFLAALLDFAILGVVDAVLQVGAGLRPFGIDVDHPGPLGDGGPISHVAYTASITGVPHWSTHGGPAALVSLLVAVFYYILLESSLWQATLGKRVCGIRVTDLSGRRIGIGRAAGRYFGKFVSWALFGIGFLMVGWTRRKQGLHDLMAGTLVMRRREADPVFTFNEPTA